MTDSTIKIKRGDPTVDVVARAAEILGGGGLVVFPTETVYGVAARADIPSAVERLRKVKSREVDKAFTVHLADPMSAREFAPQPPGIAFRLMRKGWPGPLTLIVAVSDPAATPIARGMGAGASGAIFYKNTVGLRCPSNTVARDILRVAGGPVVAASANHAGEAPPHSGQEVAKNFAGEFDLLIDAGRTQYAKPSTIVRVEGEVFELVRSGVYDARMLEDMATVRILFVCTGNTCRSPMAAGLTRKVLAERMGCEMSELEKRGVLIESAGTSGGWGRASQHAITAMKKRGIDIADHESVSLSAAKLRNADHIFAMTEGHRAAIVRLAPDVANRVSLLLGDRDVSDPIGGSEEDYERCASQLERGLADRLREVSV